MNFTKKRSRIDLKIHQRALMSIGKAFPSKLRIILFRMAGMKIGNNTRITHGFFADRPDGVTIGDNCFLNHFVHLHNGADPDTRINFGNGVFVGPEVKCLCATHEIGTAQRRAGKVKYGSIVVEDGVWIGAGAIILPGVRIAKGGVIGAGAVITKSTEPNGLYVGVPATRVRDLNK